MKYIRQITAILLSAALMIICIGCTSDESEITVGTDATVNITEETVVISDTTILPDTTAVPNITLAPETTIAPETTAIPETTAVPETTAIPETTAVPETTAIPEEPHSPLYLPNYTLDEIVRFFSEVCLDAEYINLGDPSRIQKWTSPIYYMVLGSPTDSDIAVIEEMAKILNSIEGFPGMYSTSDHGAVNLRIHFCSEKDFLSIMGSSFAGNDGGVTFWYLNDEIYNAQIAIRNDIGQELRNSVIMEEIYNGLGPIQDTVLREDSLIYSGFSSPQKMTDMDMLILNLLYHPSIKCGMNAEQCENIISELYY